MAKYHVMVDLETMGTTPLAPIVQIGAVLWDAEASEFRVLQDVKANVNTDTQPYAEWQYDTIKWWLGQSEGARHALTDPKSRALSIKEALEFFGHWLKQVPVEALWSHGATFDLPILAMHYHKNGMAWPISYRTPRDTRTLLMACQLRGDDPKMKDVGVAHDALADSYAQAEWVHRMLQLVQLERPPGV